MDPSVLLDLLYLKLTVEHRQNAPATDESFLKTRESLKRIRVPHSSPSVAGWVSQSLLNPKNETEKALAKLAIFDPLAFEDKTKLLSLFKSKHHNFVLEFADKLIPQPKKFLRLRSNQRFKVLYARK